MSQIHHLSLPLKDESIQSVALGDRVYLSGEIVITIGLPTHQRMVDCLIHGTSLPIDLKEGAFCHLSSYIRESEDGVEALYLNPSTSTRFNAYMPAIIKGLAPRVIGGKGGLDLVCVQAMKEVGCIYLSFLGGGCTPLSKAIRKVVSVHWNEYISQFRLVTLLVEELGPATVGIDAHGNSIYENLRKTAQERLPQIVEELNRTRLRQP